MKTIVVRLVIVVALLLTGAYLNEAFRAHSARQRSPDSAAQVENSLLHSVGGSIEGSAGHLAPEWSKRPDTKTPESEVLRLRGETAGLKSQVQALKNDRHDMAVRKALEHRLGRTDLKIAETPGQPFSRNTYYPASLIQDVGNASAPAALQSFIAAMTRGDYQAAIRLSPAESQERLQSLADKQLLGKYVTSESQGIKIESFTDAPTESEFVAEIDFGEDKPPVRAHFYTTNELGAWKVLPRVAVEGAVDPQ